MTGVVLFAGGKSRRMGRDKACLPYMGSYFLERIAAELDGYEEQLLSVDCPDRYADLEWKHVTDAKRDCGPLGGLVAVLEACESESVHVVTCDQPLYRRELGEWLCSLLEEPWDAVVPETADGIHPMCAVYRKRCLPVFRTQLENGDYRMFRALKMLNVRYADAAGREEMLSNINTPEEYEALLGRKPEKEQGISEKNI